MLLQLVLLHVLVLEHGPVPVLEFELGPAPAPVLERVSAPGLVAGLELVTDLVAVTDFVVLVDAIVFSFELAATSVAFSVAFSAVAVAAVVAIEFAVDATAAAAVDGVVEIAVGVEIVLVPVPLGMVGVVAVVGPEAGSVVEEADSVCVLLLLYHLQSEHIAQKAIGSCSRFARTRCRVFDWKLGSPTGLRLRGTFVLGKL